MRFLVREHLHLGGYFSDGQGALAHSFPSSPPSSGRSTAQARTLPSPEQALYKCWVGLRPVFAEHLLSVHQALLLYELTYFSP